MAITRKEAARALNAEEHELVEKSRHPAVQELADAALSDLVKLVRQRRDKARTQAEQRRREMRGKGDARGAAPSKADEGSTLKLAVLAMAMRRLNNEVERRRRMSARVALVASATKALALKQAAADAAPGFNTRHAHQGMRRKENPRAKDLVRPMERGRLRKAAAVAQAKRDAR
ncbi:MAG: hypothetical protein A3D94_17405 [Alphaproteobacteria bacterium RIFCSPHIGHO2_12_FULL_66_14]|jgi:hypothetical protein|nr:MAG: hypothetical protein A3D94_17405 [Alphaproteobacteria bacterium RIFCSPHIGHO2_12_FULL_66_14]